MMLKIIIIIIIMEITQRNIFSNNKSLTPEQQDLVEQFKSISGSNEKIAAKFLENNSWDLVSALNFFYESGESTTFHEDGTATTTTNLYDSQTLTQLFETFHRADIGDDMIDDALQHHALLKFCDAINTNPEDDSLLYIVAWLINAVSAPFTFTKQEFFDGMDALGCETLMDIKESISDWRQEIGSKKKFREFYQFVFGFANRGKIMRCATALTLWRAILKDQHMPLRNAFLSYMENHSMEPVSQDAWEGILEFLTEVKNDDDYDVDDGYPSIVDEFMMHRTENGEKQE
mmetsp:Transcript_6623/g.24751  ORF Transcript_6623/g.24751 Transcript_6623/m.24751 type:complete len:289 (+) Transcript_6623:2153-3019(+)